MWAEPERVSYVSVPRDALRCVVPSLPEDPQTATTFRYSNVEVIQAEFAAAGFQIELIEEMEIPVMEAQSDADVVDWVRAFGMNRLLHDLPLEIQAEWEVELRRRVARLKQGDTVQLGGVTRIVVARSAGLPDKRSV